jgi:TIR domain-containing protein
VLVANEADHLTYLYDYVHRCPSEPHVGGAAQMKLFISWSKRRSHDLALLLRRQLPDIIQEIDPWVSSEDIDKGQRWARDVGQQLGKIHQSIICLTAENLDQPWLNFEAGALAKSLDESRVRPLLLGIPPSAVKGPLDQFQATTVSDRNDMRKLIQSLNDACSQPLDTQRLDRQFERTWPEISEGISLITNSSPENSPEAVQRPTDDIVREVLDRVRELQRSIETGRVDDHDAIVSSRHTTPVRLADGMPAKVGAIVVHARHGIGRIQHVVPQRDPYDSGLVVVTFGEHGASISIPSKNLRLRDVLTLTTKNDTDHAP